VRPRGGGGGGGETLHERCKLPRQLLHGRQDEDGAVHVPHEPPPRGADGAQRERPVLDPLLL
jgi:hypothetical protein